MVKLLLLYIKLYCIRELCPLRDVLQHLIELVLIRLFYQMGNSFELDSPVVDKESEGLSLSSAGEPLMAGVCSVQGWRTTMEDCYLCLDIPMVPNHALLGIFDGHAGKETALFVMENLLSFLESNLSWTAYIATDDKEAYPHLLGRALKEVFIELDIAMMNSGGIVYRRSGCALVVCVVTPNHIICANAGDCRAVLGIGDPSSEAEVAVPLSQDHKVSNSKEKERIEAAGGIIQFGRLYNDLNVSRGLGDLRYKLNPELDASQQVVSCIPDVVIHCRDAELDSILLLACDGFWDVISSEQAVRRVYDLFALGEGSVRLMSEELVDGALIEGGSRDNITCILCVFPKGRRLIDGYRVNPSHVFPAGLVGVEGVRWERELAGSGSNKLSKDIYDNVKYISKVERAPGSMFYKETFENGDDY